MLAYVLQAFDHEKRITILFVNQMPNPSEQALAGNAAAADVRRVISWDNDNAGRDAKHGRLPLAVCPGNKMMTAIAIPDQAHDTGRKRQPC